ncbi:MAG: endonuclease Q family protein, partial [Methanofollis liminatans]|nr:endonuclease Q family protein [Methanofollis liminatans]
DRARELGGMHAPRDRPPYYHVIPLGEIVRVVCGTCSAFTKGVEERYRRLTDTLGTEIAILTEVPIDRIAAIDPAVAAGIAAFREGRVALVPGGGGKYGTFTLP